MLLEESGKISLQDKIVDFFPEFNEPEKKNITIEQVMRHEAGFLAEQSPLASENFENYFQRFLHTPLSYTPGSKFLYSDLGFILLARIVQKVSKQTIPEFANQNIFTPLNMGSTFYHVPTELHSLCALTSKGHTKCLPHDPLAYRFSPIKLGHAGVFSTAENLSHLTQMYLNLGLYKNIRFLKEETVRKMITHSPNQIRGLGFDLLSPYAESPRGKIYPKGISYGHTGYTGTTIWIDPASDSFLIFLSNRVLLRDELTSKKFIKLRSDISTAIGKQFYP
jgi:CubicO group peptidase (beta-lactamase class C family)